MTATPKTPDALPNLRVCSLGWIWAAPLVAAMLADLGAEVIKIETSVRQDNTRTSGGRLKDLPGQGFYSHTILRSSKSVTLDLHNAEAQEMAHRIVAQSDVVIENYRAGTMKKWRMDYETLRKVKPDLIMVSMAATGQWGPISGIGTFGSSLASLCGVDSLQGYASENRPMPFSQAVLDPFNGMQAFFPLLAALHHRNRTGRGQYIDMSLWEATVSYLGVPMMEYQMTGEAPQPNGNRDPSMAPHGLYPSKGNDAWVSIAVKNQDEWRAFCKALGDPDWTQDPKFADTYRRLKHQDDLDAHVSEWTRQRTSKEATEVLQRHGVAAMPCNSDAELFEDPHFAARGSWVEVDHPHGRETIFGAHWKFSETPAYVRAPCPLLGQHNDYTFQELLGMGKGEVERLVAGKAIV